MKTEDQTLVEGCLQRDSKYQRQLYENYKVLLFRICLRYAKDRPQAEDMLQEGFVKIFADLHQFRADGHLGAWMRRVMVNVALQYLRREKRFTFVDDATIADTHYQTADGIYAKLDAQRLTQLLQQLPVGYRTIFNLYVVEGYSHKEIAQELNISVSTSKSQLFKAKATLRKMLGQAMRA